MRISGNSTPIVADDYLCFTADESNCIVELVKHNYAPVVSLEISYDKNNWSDYTI